MNMAYGGEKMDIQRYYEKSAKISYYAAMISLIISILFFVFHFSGVMAGNILWLTLPFIILSLNYYIRFRLYEKHMKDTPAYVHSQRMQLLDSEHLLIAFLPAPSLRMQFFSKDGAFVGEIRRPRHVLVQMVAAKCCIYAYAKAVRII